MFLVVVLFLCAVSASWEPKPLHLSDLPSFHFDHHIAVKHPNGAPATSSNHSMLGHHDRCLDYKSCIKCSDNPSCVWCTGTGPKSSGGQCVLASLSVTHCEKLGGAVVDECPFFTRSLWITSSLVATCALLAAGGGIGGGALFIPVYLLVYGLTAHQAVPLSKVTIFGLAIGSYSVLYWTRHPLRDMPLIDYDLTLLLVPGILLGTIVGVYLNVIFPGFIIVVALVVLLMITSFRTWRKAFELLHREGRGDGRREQALLADDETEQIEMGTMGPSSGQREALNDALQPILEREAAVPWRKFGLFGITFVGLVTFVLLKGGAKHPSPIGLQCGSLAFFLFLLTPIFFLGTVALLVGRRLRREYHEKALAGYNFLDGDIVYDLRTTLMVPALGVGAGMAAGFLGIGAGLVVAPIMLELGVMPEVAQASSSFTILFTASSTSLQFILLGKLPFRAAGWFWCIGFVTSIIGQHLVKWMVRKYKKQWMVIFFLAVMITLSGVFMAGLNVHEIAASGIHGEFHNPCGGAIG